MVVEIDNTEAIFVLEAVQRRITDITAAGIPPADTFEGQATLAALRVLDSAQQRINDQLYPQPEPPSTATYQTFAIEGSVYSDPSTHWHEELDR